MTTTTSFLPAGVDSHRRWWDVIPVSLAGRNLDVLLVSDGDCLAGLYFGPTLPIGVEGKDGWARDRKALSEPSAQLRGYAAGELIQFDLALRPRGTSFQLEVWTALAGIPYGTTTTYGQIAGRLGRPTGSRAVGSAVGANPISIVIPCHRVIGSNGSLTGYAGGLDNKVALLQLEGVAAL